jgi:prepilin-type N-terminal cleavage/methylation domain-containing protein
MDGASISFRSRRGLTMLEVLIAMAVIGLIASFTFPTVQIARTRAQRTQCESNLRRWGDALQNHVTVKGTLPASNVLHLNLLPYLGEQEAYDNLSRRPAGPARIPNLRQFDGIEVAAYRCPSDGPGIRPAVTNYLGCSSSTIGGGGDGLFPITGGTRALKISDVFDGMSNTAAISEILVPNGTKHRRRLLWQMPPPEFLLPNQIGALLDLCDSLPKEPAEHGWRGGNGPGLLWYFPQTYNHALPPNRPMCANSGFPNTVVPPNSNHFGGVQVLMGDGAVRFVSEGIDQAAWREMATRGSP